jgi:hypothetical protein
MQNNEFYRGVLFELGCIQKIGEGTTPPPAIKPAPIPAAITTPTAPLASPGPAPMQDPAPALPPPTAPPSPAAGAPVVAGVNSAPQSTGMQLANEFKGKFPEQLINTLVTDDFQPALEAAPQGKMVDTFEDAYKNFTGGKPDANNPFTKATMDVSKYYAQNSESSGGSALMDGLKKTYEAGEYVKAIVPKFQQLAPTEKASFIKALTEAYPAKLAPAFQQDAKRYIDETTGKMGFGDLWNKATGPTDPNVDAMGQQFPELKDYATNSAIGRAGSLTGDWLKNNWGKLAAGVGGGGLLIALLSQIMGGGEDGSRSNQPVQRRVNAPQSF